TGRVRHGVERTSVRAPPVALRVYGSDVAHRIDDQAVESEGGDVFSVDVHTRGRPEQIVGKIAQAEAVGDPADEVVEPYDDVAVGVEDAERGAESEGAVWDAV